MKARVWDALISKEESQMSVVRRQFDEMNEQHAHIRNRIEYIDSLLSEYATSSISSPLKLTTYQLQLLRMRDKLTEEKRFLKAELIETQQQLQSHNNEIRKYGKMRTRTVTQHHQSEQRKENRLMDESGIMQFNLQRRTEG
jgi:flagellar export protein FliJ